MANLADTTNERAITSDDDVAAIAASEWEAWEGRPEDSDMVPTKEEYGSQYAVQLRMCLAVMHKTKPELIEIARKMWAEGGIQDGDENMSTDS